MKYMRTAVIGTISAVAITVAASALADRGERHQAGHLLERISDRLELDENQSAALTALGAELIETRELMRGTDGDVRAQLTDLISAETFDQDKALAMINERSAALQANAPELVSAAALFFEGLTAEQKEKIQAFSEKARGRHWHH